MTEREIITEAYDETIKKVFAAFYSASVLADTPAKRAEAEQRFVRGIQFARELRDRAIAILPAA